MSKRTQAMREMIERYNATHTGKIKMVSPGKTTINDEQIDAADIVMDEVVSLSEEEWKRVIEMMRERKHSC